jgi:hypothetical protein
VIHLRHCSIEHTPEGCITRFADGSEIASQPHDTHHYAVISHRTGCGDDLLAYCRDHELAHALVEERLHDRPSQILWALAHGHMLTGKEAAYEEIAAQTLQRWVRPNERPIIGGVNWDRLKADFLALSGSAAS